MSGHWDSILRTTIAGAARSPVPENLRLALQLDAGDDAARTALYALPAAWLLQKAAAPLADAPAEPPPPCPPDERPLCAAEAVKSLKAMLLFNVYPDVLPEFFELLNNSGRRLPPENLPLVLDYAARKKQLPGGLRTALGPAGAWLAARHPDWAALYAPAAADWHTGTPAERLRLLRDARRNRPLVGNAWLSSTWAKERAEHKLRFLEALRNGLSPADETLLQTALRDKNPAVRRLACRLLLLLPGSALLSAFRGWLRGCLRGGLPGAGLYAALLRHAPGSDPFAGQAAVLPAGEAAAAALLELAPPPELALAAGLPAEALLAEIRADEYPGAARGAWLGNIAWNGDPEWLAAAVRLFQDRPGHAVWTSEEMKILLLALPEPLWQPALTAVARHGQTLLETPASALVQTLLETERRWPKPMLEAVLQYPLPGKRGRQWAPPPHLLALLECAAYRCRPTDAEELPAAENDWPYAWHSELIRIRSVLQFRQRLIQAFQG